MGTNFLHGAEVIHAETAAGPVQAPAASVIGLAGWAYSGPVNVPTIVRTAGEGAAIFGAEGSIAAALDGIFAQARTPVIAVNAMDPAAHKTAVADEPHVFDVANPGVQAGHRHLVAGSASVKDKNGAMLVEGAHFAVDLEAGLFAFDADAADAPGEDDNIKISYEYLDSARMTGDVIAGSQAAGAYSGAHALLLRAADAPDLRPRILCAPGFSQVAAAATKILPVAKRLRATLVIDGPSTDDAAAIALRDAIDSEHAFIVDPKVIAGASGERWASPYVAGLIAATDRDVGWHRSPSNRPILGISDTARPIDWGLDDPDSRANLLNASEVATIIRQGGFRLWGNRTCSSDPRWKFLNVVRIRDQIDEALIESHLWAIDRNIDSDYGRAVSEGVNAFLRSLAPTAILGGSCRPADPELNSAAAVQGGRSYFDVEFTPVTPSERITFRVAITTDRYEEVLQPS